MTSNNLKINRQTPDRGFGRASQETDSKSVDSGSDAPEYPKFAYNGEGSIYKPQTSQVKESRPDNICICGHKKKMHGTTSGQSFCYDVGATCECEKYRPQSKVICTPENCDCDCHIAIGGSGAVCESCANGKPTNRPTKSLITQSPQTKPETLDVSVKSQASNQRDITADTIKEKTKAEILKIMRRRIDYSENQSNLNMDFPAVFWHHQQDLELLKELKKEIEKL